DPKFLSEFWKTLFRCVGTKILASTAYHPQTDGQSEQTNQTVQIALRYYISERQTDWADSLDIVQAALVTSVHSSIGKTPAELLYGLNPKHILDLANPSPSDASEDWASLREILRKEAVESISYANEIMKLHADRKHEDFTLAVGDKAYIRLHKGYHLAGIPKAKFGQQRVGPFEVL